MKMKEKRFFLCTFENILVACLKKGEERIQVILNASICEFSFLLNKE